MSPSNFLITLLISSILSGCGGSDNSSTVNPSNNPPLVENPIDNDKPEDTATEPNTLLTLEAVRRTRSGNTHDPQAIFIVHDNSGNIIGQHQADPAGKVQVSWTDQAAHLTYITLNDNQVLKLQSFMNISADDLQDKRFIYQEKNCKSATLTLELNMLTHQAMDEILVVNGINENSIVLSPTNEETRVMIEYCENQPQLPIQLINAYTGTAKAGLMSLTGFNEYTLSLSDFTAEGIYVDLSTSEHWEYVTLAGNYHQISRDNSLPIHYPDYIYPALNTHTQVKFFHPFEENYTDTNEDFTLTVIANSRRNISNDAQLKHAPHQLTFSPLDNMQSKQFFKQILKHPDRLTLDFMSLASRYQQIAIEVCDEQGNERHHEACNENKLNWRIHSFSSKNSHPWQVLEFPSDIKDTLNQLNQFAISLHLIKHLEPLDKIDKLSELTEGINNAETNPVHDIDSLSFGIIMKKSGE
ncbi:hypothetical protein [uncultured Shewanella sp.]|uniref:hypothetical protein n=1 Tax=uncultured Shewanella sp. TaxID=173975 RepID=UPI00260D1A39|nr:hypothetical protein [uncultured Shewanella sp.]